MSESDLRYTFACPACSSSFSISLERIPPVQARFSCPKCGKPMDFPSREEARVFIQLQASEGAPPSAAAMPAAAAPPKPAAPPSRPPDPPAAAPPPPPPAPRPAPSAAALDSTATETGTGRPEKTYRVDGKGFERDVFDRRAMRTLIRTLAVNETSMVGVGDAVPVRASEIPELKSLFELRKTARATPLPVCRSHLEVVAHYVCGDTGRPLCEECAPEKKFGGTSLRVCDHCGGTARDLHDAPAEID